MNVLVAGGAGYVGSTTVEALLNHDHQVVVLDNLSTGDRRALPVGAAFIQADIANNEKVVFGVLEHNVEAVVHFAFQSDLNNSFGYFSANTVKTLSLLATLLKYGVDKLVLSSTATIYGQSNVLPVNEQTAPNPEDVYSESLYLVERMLPWLNQTRGLSYISLRYFNAAGTSGRFSSKERAKDTLIHKALRAAKTKQATTQVDTLVNEADHLHDYLHVLDVAEAHVLALESLKDGDAKIINLDKHGTSHKEEL